MKTIYRIKIAKSSTGVTFKQLLIILITLLFIVGSSIDAKNLYQNLACPIFPIDNILNTPIDDMPVDKNSDIYVQTIGANLSLHPDFGSGIWNNAPIGIPYVLVSGNQPKVKITFEYSDESDPGPYPIPPNPPIEGGNASSGDRHILVVDTTNCLLYETWSTYPNGDGSWRAGSGAIFDLKSNKLRPDTWTSSDAAGLPVLPLLLRYDEVAKGEINHAIRFTVPKTRREYYWPARHFASSLTDAKYPPMGLRFRLKKEFDISGFSKENKVILTCLKKYGMILADNGSAWFITGAPDPGWDDEDLNLLKTLKGKDFEAVDCSSMMIDKNSGQAKQKTNSATESSNVESFSISPNPATDFIEISYPSESSKLSEGSSIRIYSVFGEFVNLTPTLSMLGEGDSSSQYSVLNTQYLKIDVSTLVPGLYFVKFGDEVGKFVKL